MKNIVLTEKQFDLFLKNKLLESISVPNGMDEGGDENVQRVIDYLRDTYNSDSDDEEMKKKRDNLRRLAKVNQVNFDYSEDDAERRKKEILDNKNEEILEWVGKYLQPLRDCWNGKNFMKSKEVAKYSPDKGVYNTQTPKGAYDKLSGDLKANVINLASFLDKNKLTCIYRDFQKQPSVSFSCGLNLKDDSINCNTPIDVLVGKRDANGKIIEKGLLDFSSATNDELLSMYDGTRVATINKEVGLDGKTNYSKDEENWEKISTVTARKLNELRAKRYIRSTYGMEMKFGNGNKMFKFGNAKVYKDTLIVNFTSAIRCPAWNECIMKDACYAKSAEVNYDDAFNSNLKKNLIWEQTKIDSKLMQMMKGLLRSYLLNYVKLPIVGKIKNKEKKKDFVWELCQMSLYEIEANYGKEAIKILEDTRNGNLIRLNEDGDFIGQWLVDAFDEFAAELELVGINIAAYTCRALNYEAVEHLILNISQQGLVSNQKSKGFAHFFYAIDPKDYSRLGETYGGPNYSLEITNGKIVPVYRKLVDNKGELKGYYYKCPCGRGKYEYVPSTEAKYTLTCVDGIERDPETQCFYGETSIDGEIVNAKKIRTYFVYDRQKDIFYIKNGRTNSYRIISTSGIDDDDDSKSDKFDYGTSLPMTIVTASPTIFVDVNERKVYVKKIVKRDNGGVGAKKDKTSADCYMCRICYARDKDNSQDPYAVRYEGGAKEGDVPVYVFVATHGANRNEFQGEQGRKVAGKKVSDWVEILNKTSQPQEMMESIFGEEENIEEEPKSDKLAIRCIVYNFIDSVRSRMSDKSVALNEIKTKFNDMLTRING